MRWTKTASAKACLVCWVVTSGSLVAVTVVARLSAQQSATRTVKIPDGTLVPLYLKDDLSSKKNKPNDPIRFQVREDVRVAGVVVIPAGTAASGHVEKVGGAGFAGHAGKLNFVVDSLKLADGATIPLRGSPTLKGGSNTAVAAAATVAYGPAGLLMRGSHADIRKGTMLSAYVDGARQVVVTVPTLSALVPAQAAPAPAAKPTEPVGSKPPPQAVPSPPPSEERCGVEVKSTPEGAEILLDGKYVGNTPSTLRVAAGEHTIAVRKSGFLLWQRTLAVIAGANVTVNASLRGERKGLSHDQITELLAGGVPNTRLIQLVEERGVDFPWSGETEQKLRNAGAQETLIKAIRAAAEKSTTPP